MVWTVSGVSEPHVINTQNEMGRWESHIRISTPNTKAPLGPESSPAV